MIQPVASARWRRHWSALSLAVSVMVWRAGWALPLALLLLVATLPISWSRADQRPLDSEAPTSPAPHASRDELAPMVPHPTGSTLTGLAPMEAAVPASLHQHLSSIHATAAAHGLRSDHADYRRESVDGSDWVRWRLTQVHRGREADLRTALAAVLSDHPWITLDRLRIDHAPANGTTPDGSLTARLEWSLWRPPVAPLEAAKTAESPTPRSLFALTVAPSQPTPSTAAPSSNEPPLPPPLPYRYVGQQTNDQGRRWFLERDGHVLIVEIGDVLQDHYRVSRAEEALLWLTHIASGTEQSLPTEPLR